MSRFTICARVGLGVSVSALALVALPSMAQTSRFEVLNGNLIDHTTGLVWQSLAATAGDPLPITAQLPTARVVTATELFNVVGSPSNYALSIQSDTFAALEFFASTDAGGVVGAPGSNTGSFSGWWNDTGGQPPNNLPAVYNVAFFSFAPSTTQSGYVDVMATTTIGSYTQSNCPAVYAFCGHNEGLFTVLTVPEPSTVSMWLLGLYVLGRRRWV